ncbi:MAG: hypothetical protein V2I25_11505 [Woeseiaceae bacterium]|jgi:hypothetical protein|nr:hypothetical protein [Woeseiaceae bacterium]
MFPYRLAVTLLLALGAVAASADEYTVTISVEPARAGRWNVEYALSSPVDALIFARGNGDYRRATWTLPRGFRMERLGATDRVSRKNGKPFSRLKATIETHTERIPNDYTPFIRFSDGSEAMFTGQFIVGVPESGNAGDYLDGADDANTLWPAEATIVLDPGRFGAMIVGARVESGPQPIAIGEGEYVYFGSAEALETPHLVSVMDAAAPTWLRDLLYESMALTFQYYEEHLGALAGGKPFMLTSFTPLDGRRISFTGGVIGSQIAIQLALGDGIQDTPSEREFMAQFFAHESAHLWNNGQVIAADGTESWLHEGSAEAMGWLALADLGIHSDAAALALFERAANECVRFLGNGSLRSAARRDEFQAYYECGATIALATHGLMRQQGEDLFALWRRLIADSLAAQSTYGAEDYYRHVNAVSPRVADAIRAVADAVAEEPSAAVRNLLEAGGVVVYEDADGALRLDRLP